MADKHLNVRILQRTDTISNWKTNNPILAAGEIAVATFTASEAKDLTGIEKPITLIKIGDGEKEFNSLDWIFEDIINSKQDKLSVIILSAEAGTLTAEQLATIIAEPATTIIVNNKVFRLSVKDPSKNKFIYCSNEIQDENNIANIKLDLDTSSGMYSISLFETPAVKELQTTVDTLNTNVTNLQSNLGAVSDSLTDHINDTNVHIQPGEREKWNNKITCNILEGDISGDFTLELTK